MRSSKIFFLKGNTKASCILTDLWKGEKDDVEGSGDSQNKVLEEASESGF